VLSGAIINRRARSYASNARTPVMSAAMKNTMLKTLMRMITGAPNELGNKPGMGVGVNVAVGGGVIVGAEVGVLATVGVAASVAVAVGARGVPSSGGIINVLPTRKRELVVNPFASKMILYLVPSPYTFCAMIQGLSPD